MSSLREYLVHLWSTIPGPDDLVFKSSRDRQDFVERDFDRRLALFQVEVLVTIADHLEKLNDVDTGTRTT